MHHINSSICKRKEKKIARITQLETYKYANTKITQTVSTKTGSHMAECRTSRGIRRICESSRVFFTTQLAVKEKLLEEIKDKINQEQEEWNTKTEDPEKRCTKEENVTERRRFDL